MIESSSALSLTLLGSIQIQRHGRSLSALATDKAGALLAYLVVEGASQRRETLSALFWPEMNEQRARANLSQALYVLRKACSSAADAPPLLLADARTVQLNPAAPLVCDFWQLRQAFAGCPSHHPQAAEECEVCCMALQQGVDLLQGEFLGRCAKGCVNCPPNFYRQVQRRL